MCLMGFSVRLGPCFHAIGVGIWNHGEAKGFNVRVKASRANINDFHKSRT
jgi:hypothetical protein